MANFAFLKKNAKNSIFIWGIIIFIGIVVFLLVLLGINKIFQTDTYYVLDQDVSTRTQISSEMLTPITTSKGTSPKSAIGLSEVQTGNVFTKYPLKTGDILTESNVGALDDISVGVPDSWVVTTFSVNSNDAAGGRIQRGTYFDMMVTDGGNTFYPFVNVLALDTTTDNVSTTQASSDSNQTSTNQSSTGEYTVGMPPKDAARLQSIIKKYKTDGIKLVLSPRQNEYNTPQLSDYSGKFSFDSSTPTGANTPENLGVDPATGQHTDYTFTPLQRNEFGQPTGVLANCGAGNRIVQPDSNGSCPQGLTLQGNGSSPSASTSSSSSSPSSSSSSSSSSPSASSSKSS